VVKHGNAEWGAHRVQEGMGEHRRVQASTGNCKNWDFIGQGESRHINATSACHPW